MRQYFIIQAVGKTDAGKRNVPASKLSFPVRHHLCSELLVERTRVGQEASGEQDVTDQPAGLCLKALSRLGPTYALSRQTLDQCRSVVHLAPTRVCVVHERLQCVALTQSSYLRQFNPLEIRGNYSATHSLTDCCA